MDAQFAALARQIAIQAFVKHDGNCRQASTRKKAPQNEVQRSKYYMIFLRRKANITVIKETKIEISEHARQKQRQGFLLTAVFSILYVNTLKSERVP